MRRIIFMRIILPLLTLFISVSAFGIGRFDHKTVNLQIADNKLNLVWRFYVNSSKRSFKEAQRQCGTRSRLPTETELLSLLNKTSSGEFPLKPLSALEGNFWSSTTLDNKAAMVVNFDGNGMHMYTPFNHKSQVVCVYKPFS